MPRGQFIVLEGIDGSGTTSAAAHLERALADRGHPVLRTFEPSDGEIGRMIRRHLRADRNEMSAAALALLFAADREHHVKTVVEPALAAGTVVVCDRYVMSSWAYQSLTCDEAWVKSLNRHAPWPDLTVVLQVAADVAFARVQDRAARDEAARERFDVPETQRALADRYAAHAADPGLDHVVTVDASRPLEEVQAAVLHACIEAGL